MFDYYRLAPERRCPVCDRPLKEWQGKGANSGLFVWAEGNAAPVDQLVDNDIALETGRRELMRLPARFEIYSHDCPEHRPIQADCRTLNGVWIETVIRPFDERRMR